MAQTKRKSSKSVTTVRHQIVAPKPKGNVPAAVGHALIGSFPLGGGTYEGYKAGKRIGGGGGAVAGAALGTLVPGAGTLAGGYHGYHRAFHHSVAHHTQGGRH